MHWYIHKKVTRDAAMGTGPVWVLNVQCEINRMNEQRCWICSGWGHSVKKCPTAVKIRALKVGVREQTAVLKEVLETTRASMIAQKAQKAVVPASLAVG